MEKHHLIHLYNRIGFGILPKQTKKLKRLSIDKNVDLLFKKSNEIKALTVDFTDLNTLESLGKSDSKKRKIQKENRKLKEELNVTWYNHLYNSETLLHDKMKLFWTNHFVCTNNKIKDNLEYLRVIDKFSLGNFKEFLLAITKNPMMIRYLNNQQNRKKHPNENYARELMELFTLGVGHYSEFDIKESARAFTGWSSKKETFIFRKNQHDYGSKTFLGETGDFDGTDIIDIILEQEQCAIFISQKIYKEFVNPKPNMDQIKKMAKIFRKNYDISELMEYTLKSNWFYDDENIRAKIKSPVELLVGIHNVIPFTFKKKKFFKYLQYNLGQKLLYPPNVAGWPGDKQWIDANTIMLRLKLVSTIAQQKNIELEPESAFEDDFDMISKRKKNKKYFSPMIPDWNKFEQQTKGIENKYWQEVLLGLDVSSETQKIINTTNINSTKDFCIAIMSLPEYQMC